MTIVGILIENNETVFLIKTSDGDFCKISPADHDYDEEETDFLIRISDLSATRLETGFQLLQPHAICLSTDKKTFRKHAEQIEDASLIRELKSMDINVENEDVLPFSQLPAKSAKFASESRSSTSMQSSPSTETPSRGSSSVSLVTVPHFDAAHQQKQQRAPTVSACLTDSECQTDVSTVDTNEQSDVVSRQALKIKYFRDRWTETHDLYVRQSVQLKAEQEAHQRATEELAKISTALQVAENELHGANEREKVLSQDAAHANAALREEKETHRTTKEEITKIASKLQATENELHETKERVNGLIRDVERLSSDRLKEDHRKTTEGPAKNDSASQIQKDELTKAKERVRELIRDVARLNGDLREEKEAHCKTKEEHAKNVSLHDVSKKELAKAIERVRELIRDVARLNGDLREEKEAHCKAKEEHAKNVSLHDVSKKELAKAIERVKELVRDIGRLNAELMDVRTKLGQTSTEKNITVQMISSTPVRGTLLRNEQEESVPAKKQRHADTEPPPSSPSSAAAERAMDVPEEDRPSKSSTPTLKLQFKSGSSKLLTEAAHKQVLDAGIQLMDVEGFSSIPADDIENRADWCSRHEAVFEEYAKAIESKMRDGVISSQFCPLCTAQVRGQKVAYIREHYTEMHWRRMKCSAHGCDKRKKQAESGWHPKSGKDRFTTALCPTHRPPGCDCCSKALVPKKASKKE